MIDLFFRLGNLAILPFWLSMLVAPQSQWTRRLLRTPWMSAVLAVLYALLVVPEAGTLLPLLARPQLSEIAALLGTPLGAAAGWLHFLAFDLFVGRWIWKDALDSKFSLGLLRPILLLTLLFGPLGLLLYLLARSRFLTARPLLGLAGAMLALVVISTLGLALDSRTITNLPAWIKPLKFALSVLTYALTLEAILGVLPAVVTAQRIRQTTAFCLHLEMAVVVLQTVRGATSHFNTETPFDAALFTLMGAAIVPVWLCAMATCWLAVRQREMVPGLDLALRWGLLSAVVGMGSAWPMTVLGGHTIGAPDGGPGLPLLGWSTLAGDLRVAHFLGLHALQALPLLWWSLRGRLSPSGLRLALHWAGLAYLIWVVLLTRQALAGQTAFCLAPTALWPILAGLPLLWAGREGFSSGRWGKA